jgi:hypothetical protein
MDLILHLNVTFLRQMLTHLRNLNHSITLNTPCEYRTLIPIMQINRLLIESEVLSPAKVTNTFVNNELFTTLN